MDNQEQQTATVRLAKHAVLTAPQEGHVLAGASVGPGGEVIAIWAASADEPRLTGRFGGQGGGSFPEPRARPPVPAVVKWYGRDHGEAVRIDALPLGYPVAQPLPDGKILLVGPRSRWRPSGADRNAIVYDADGRFVADGILGDGINHVLTTGSGQIWVGYSDEGVFGNFGWGREGPSPVGACGLARFTPDLRQDWQFPRGADGLDSICDCYALNLDGETAWTCYYTGFPVVRIDDGRPRGWRSQVTAASALIVGGGRLAQFGGYGTDRNLVVVSTLDDDEVRPAAEYRLVLPGGQDLPRGFRFFGRGPDLHVIAGDHWYRLGLDDLPACGAWPE
jgi:hypothetical protein